MGQLGKMLLLLAAVLGAVGLVLIVGEKLGLGRLPGDLVWRGKRWSVHFPLATSILISLVLTVLLNLWFRGK
jgi:hypothetical protein